ncbi:MAG TPA: hypothetical protein PLL69_02090 [Gemmatimonadales bacterium]|nr:hypothetical protein [Gemmatimonadales bacterium]
MSPTLRNILALVAGLVIGGAVNMTLITISPSIVPPPPGVDVTDPESLSQNIHLFAPRHFIMPFLAHALGTLVGALVAFKLAATHKARWAWVVGGFFLAGGIMASALIPAPTWFIALDLIVAYLPMAWLAIRIGEGVGAGVGAGHARPNSGLR